MTYYLQAKLYAMVDFSKEELDLISECAKTHYDFTVKEMIAPGGFLYGYRYYVDACEPSEDLSWDFSFRQLDLILKSLEMHLSDTRIRDIYNKIRCILEEINKEGKNINDTLSL